VYFINDLVTNFIINFSFVITFCLYNAIFHMYFYSDEWQDDLKWWTGNCVDRSGRGIL